jgi:hydroxymethylpyrimidine pyrophosphatase-like HAD family hydrolase
MTQAQYSAAAETFLATARHPQLDALYTDLVYQPMLELLDYLRAGGFDVHIVSGGTVEFIRAYADDVYGVPPQSVVGSSFAYEFRDTSGIPEIFRNPDLSVFNDSAVKPVSIQLHIGKRPILAFGNSDGDLQMLEYTDDGSGPALALLLHHDDAEREFAYDEGAENALQAAGERGWTVVSMKNDFARVFPDPRR